MDSEENQQDIILRSLENRNWYFNDKNFVGNEQLFTCSDNYSRSSLILKPHFFAVRSTWTHLPTTMKVPEFGDEIISKYLFRLSSKEKIEESEKQNVLSFLSKIQDPSKVEYLFNENMKMVKKECLIYKDTLHNHPELQV